MSNHEIGEIGEAFAREFERVRSDIRELRLESRQRWSVLNESIRDEIRLVAEGVTANGERIETVVDRFDRLEVRFEGGSGGRRRRAS